MKRMLGTQVKEFLFTVHTFLFDTETRCLFIHIFALHVFIQELEKELKYLNTVIKDAESGRGLVLDQYQSSF